MKKLMITLSAAALATGAFADEVQATTLASGTETFESFDLTQGNVTISNSTTNSDGQKLWYSKGDAEEVETGAVTAYGEDDAKHEDIAEAGNKNYLNVSTTTGTPLYRKLAAHDNQSGLDENSDSLDIGDGIYVDTYVQFTASETAPTIPVGSKLVVWVQAIDFDDNNTAEDTSDDIQGSTNLIVTAAQLSAGGVPTTTNFVIETSSDFIFEDWHRLTIRTIKDITKESKIAGFTVFVDGEQLEAKATQIAGVDAVTYNDLMGAYDYDTNLTMEANKFYTNRQLFVSLVGSELNYGAAAQKLSAVGFDGSGKIDNVTVTDDPVGAEIDFAKGNYFFSVKWGDGVTEFTLTSGEWSETYTVTGEEANNTKVFDVPYVKDVTKLTLSNIEVTSGTTLGTGAGEHDLSTLFAEIKTENTQFTITVGDVTTPYATLQAAFNAAGQGGVIKLYKDLNLTDDSTLVKGLATVSEGMDVVLDLAGKKLIWTDGKNDMITVDGGKLTIKSSVAGGMISEPEGYVASVLGGELVLGQPSDDEGAYVLGELIADGGAITLVRGYLSSDYFDGVDSLEDGMTLADGSAVSEDTVFDGDENEYYAITCGGSSDPDTEIEAGSESVEYTEEQDAIDAAKKIETITVPEEDKGTVDSGWFKAAVVKKEKEGGSFVWVVKPILDKDAAGVIKDVVPTVEAAVKEILGSADNDIFKADDNGDITINLTGLVQGLTYGVEVVTDLKNLGTGEPIWGGKVGATKTTAIKVQKPAGGKAFFKIHVDYK